MKRFITTLAAGAVALASSLPALADGSVSGKFSAYSSVSGVAFPGILTTVTTATILKGKKKRVLEVEGTAVELTNTSTGMGVNVTVNGVPMEPIGTAFQVVENCGPSIVNCTATGHYWLDLDAAELANPGLFINQPLVVSLGVSAVGSSISGSASLRARLVKK